MVLFITDGLPTEGVTEREGYSGQRSEGSHAEHCACSPLASGDDVDTFPARSRCPAGYRGVSVYVRPKEDIEQQVSSLYNKITSPVLTALKLDFGNAIVDDMYPSEPLPDLFAGSAAHRRRALPR